MGFIMGVFFGVLVSIAACGFFAWYVCSRSSSADVSKLVSSIIQALAQKSKPSVPSPSEKDGEATDRPR